MQGIKMKPKIKGGKGRPATGKGKSVYIPDHLLGIVDRLKAKDWEGAVKDILNLCPFND